MSSRNGNFNNEFHPSEIKKMYQEEIIDKISYLPKHDYDMYKIVFIQSQKHDPSDKLKLVILY